MHTPPPSPWNRDDVVILTEEVCDLLKFKRSRVYYLTSTERVRIIKIDGSLRFVKQEVLEWFKSLRKGKGSA